MPFVLILVLCLCAPLLAAKTPAVAPRLPAAPRHRVVAADFVQIRHLAELDMDVESRGKMVSELDGRVRWQVDSPVASVTLIDSEKLLHYDGETGKTAVIELDKFPWLALLREALNDWFSGDPKRLAERFDVTSPWPEILRLVPREAGLKKLCRQVDITFSVADGTISRIVITENAGDTLEMRFSKVATDPELPPSTWRMPER